MKWTLDTNTVRKGTDTTPQPATFAARVEVEHPADGETVTLAQYRQLLSTVVNQLNIPDTARLTEGTKLQLEWS